jgi:type I restriction enzyme R subunit
MYVDKKLDDIKAVQTLSRLNRAHPDKYDTFVLDFANAVEDIKESFSRYYKTTLLSNETDPNRLYELISAMEKHEVYTEDDVEKIVERYLKGITRDKLDSILDICAGNYKELDEDSQVEFKASAKNFARLYDFLGAILSYGMASWEKLSIFLMLLIPKLPSPKDDDNTKDLLKVIDLESYRVQAQDTINISLNDANYEIDPVSIGTVFTHEPEYDFLSNILSDFHSRCGNIKWQDEDNIKEQIKRIPDMVAKDEAYQNAMKNADEQSARMESSRALNATMLTIMQDCMELYKQYSDNQSFSNWLTDSIFQGTYKKAGHLP